LLHHSYSNNSNSTADANIGSQNVSPEALNTNRPDWCDLAQQFMLHGYNTALCANSANTTIDHPLLMIERSYNPPATRQMTAEMLFEELHVPAMFLAKDAVLACYGCGRTSATVVDVGYSGTTVTPVFEGYVEAKGIRRNPGASVLGMDEMIIHQLDKMYYKKKKQRNTYTVMPLYQLRSKNHKMRKLSIHTAARLHIAQECREEGAGATINTATDGPVGVLGGDTASGTFNAPSKPFELPDGTMIDVPSVDRFRAANLVYGSDDMSQQARDARLSDVKSKLQEYLTYLTAVTSDQEDEQYQKELARESVGLVSDGSNRSKRPRRGLNPADSSKASSRLRKTTLAWQRACQTQFQTLLDDQLTSSSIANMICDSAYSCDREQQAALLSNVIVSGGGSCLGPTEQAVPDVVRDSVEALIHQHTPGWRVKVLSPALNERAVLPWIGGSILGSLGTFHEMWVTKSEYDEWGSAIVNRKCP
jgi:actin-related protein